MAMTRGQSWTLHLSTLLVGGTGLIYAWMLYLLEPVDELSILNHPWQALMQHAHIWFAPLMVFGIGMIWRSHVWQYLRSGKRSSRRSGLLLAGCAAPMAVSGYFLQTAVGEGWRTAWLGIHLGSSGLFLCGYLVHQVLSVRDARAKRAMRRAYGVLREGGEQPPPALLKS